jgi:hypothetical protein
MSRKRIPSKNADSKKWTHIPFEYSDLPAIERFFKEQYTGPGKYGTMGMFQWKIVDNYVMPGIINLVKDHEQIVCTMSVTPKRLFLRGQENIVAEIGDIYTVFKYRRYGLFPLLANQSTKEALEKDINFIYGLPNAQAKPGWEKRANYKTIPNINIKSLVFPINIDFFFQKRGYWLIGNLAGSLFSTLVYGYLLTKKVLVQKQGKEIEELKKVPDDWNEFWEESRKVYDFILCRDCDAIRWRFIESPNKYKFYLFRDNGKIIGYLVYRIIFGEELKNLTVADYLFIPGHEKEIRILLAKILKDALFAGVNIISAWCPTGSPYFEFFKKFGFLVRNDIPIICFQNDFSNELKASCQLWHFTVSDSDNI